MIWVYPNLPMEDVEERIVHRGLTAKRSQSHLQLSSVQDVQDHLLVDDIIAGWWFGCHFLCSYIGLLIIPIDFHIFQRGGPTINQYNWLCYPNLLASPCTGKSLASTSTSRATGASYAKTWRNIPVVHPILLLGSGDFRNGPTVWSREVFRMGPMGPMFCRTCSLKLEESLKDALLRSSMVSIVGVSLKSTETASVFPHVYTILSCLLSHQCGKRTNLGTAYIPVYICPYHYGKGVSQNWGRLCYHYYCCYYCILLLLLLLLLSTSNQLSHTSQWATTPAICNIWHQYITIRFIIVI